MNGRNRGKRRERQRSRAVNPLDPGEFQRLNQQFYRADPASIFILKLNMLILAASRSIEDLSTLLVGSEFEDSIRITLAPGALIDDQDAQALQSYVIAEAHSVRYQAAECLMRLYLAHVLDGPCPWIDLAQLPTGGEFNSKVAAIADGATDLEAEVARIFTANNPLADADSLSAAQRFIRLTAEYLGESRHLHNAVKHGLGVVPGRAGLTFQRDRDSETVFGLDGPSIVYLERSRAVPARIDWHEVTQWISLRQTMFLTRLAITQIDALWTVARMRYLNDRPPGIELITNEGIDMALVGALAEPHAMAKFRRRAAIQ